VIPYFSLYHAHPQICDVCVGHCKDMASKKVPVGHDGFAARVAAFPWPTVSSAENVAMMGTTNVARDAVNGWINSPGHRKNLLSKQVFCGIGVYLHGNQSYLTQMFAIPQGY
jgi:uncharacterized protein YkwD